MLRTFSKFKEAALFYDELWPVRVDIEGAIERRETLPIYCPVCERASETRVGTGALFGLAPNLREGLHCDGCNMGNRNRLMHVLTRIFAPVGSHAKAAVFEPPSPLTDNLRNTGYQLSLSAFQPGTGDRLHQDMTKTTYRQGQFDLVVHNDVLEHVPDTMAALRDNHRILRRGGVLVFTAPVVTMARTITRARLKADGSIEHILPPEIHGDPLSPDGALAFYNFGFDIVEMTTQAGFSDAQLAVLYDPAIGFTTNNHPARTAADGSTFGNMLPCAVVARR